MMSLEAIGHLVNGRLAPGPRGNVLLGSLPDLVRNGLHTVVFDAFRRHGDLTCFRVGSKLVYLIVHPEHVERVLIERREIYTKRSHRAVALLGKGLPVAEGEIWKRQRRLLQPQFTRHRIASLVGHMITAVEQTAARWETLADRGEAVDISAEMLALSLDGISRAITGRNPFEGAPSALTAIQEAFDFVSASKQVFRVPQSVPTPGNLRFKRNVATIDAFIYRLIAERRAAGGEASDLLSFLLRARDADDGSGMDELQLRDEVVTLFLAGHETTARVLTWTCYLLSQHGSAREAIRSELSEVLGGRAPGEEDAARLPWLTAVIQESMRLYPPLWIFPREVSEDDEINGYVVPAGATVMICTYLSHRHPDFWEEPDAFRPERFLSEQTDRRRRGTYYPFGLGPRTCIANHFALLQVQIALAMLLQRFRLRPASRSLVEPEFSTTMRPRGGLWMTIHRDGRESPASGASHRAGASS